MTKIFRHPSIEPTHPGAILRDDVLPALTRTNFPREVAEACLAHAIQNAVEATYLRGSFWDKRVQLMDAWARFCTEPPAAGEVVPLRKGGGHG